MAFAKFKEGNTVLDKPVIRHDHGFLDDGKGNIDPSKKRAATWADYRALAKWEAMLAGAKTLRPDLDDATRSYSHFLDATGTDLVVAYEDFLTDDDSGKTVLKSAVADAVAGAISIHDGKMGAPPPTAAREDNFYMVSDAVAVGGRDPRYPYPKKENWQKTIGAHYIWMDAAVKVKIDPAAGKRIFEVKMNLNMEDMYNFNPGAADIATGTKDAENGRFEVTGLGKEFLSKATVIRTITFTEPLAPVPDTRVAPPDQNVTAGR
jgi:hypothetical protein